MQPANLLAFYRTVADRSPIPVLIYSVPVFTKYDMPAELVIELAEHANIIGIKESGGDAEKIRQIAQGTRHIKRSATVTETFAAVTPRMLNAARSEAPEANGVLVPVAALAGGTSTGDARRPAITGAPPSSSGVSVLGNLKTRQKEVGFQILAGSAQKLHPSLQAGAVGGVLAFSTPAPTACYEIYAAWKEGDQELARLKQERITAAATRVGSELGIPGLKYALDLNGYYGGLARLPFLPLTATSKADVEHLMADIRN
jgi:dihydrodipicolinate synthase/N-acetylneuraminate lyase